MKLNCDEECKENSELAGCRSLLRDYGRRWLDGFSCKIGAFDARHVKM